ncbi:hypothetical protein ABH922_005750 [Rhodococcus sp. 27YEA15]
MTSSAAMIAATLVEPSRSSPGYIRFTMAGGDKSRDPKFDPNTVLLTRGETFEAAQGYITLLREKKWGGKAKFHPNVALQHAVPLPVKTCPGWLPDTPCGMSIVAGSKWCTTCTDAMQERWKENQANQKPLAKQVSPVSPEPTLIHKVLAGAILATGLIALIGLASCSVAAFSDSDDTPTHRVPSNSNDQCAVLRFTILSDASSDSEKSSAAAKYSMRCQ